MAEEILRLNLDRAFDPGPYFPHPSLLSRTMAMLDVEVNRPHRRPSYALPTLPRAAMQLVAAVMIVVLAVAAVAVFLAIHHPFGPTPVHAPPFRITAPGASACYGTCGVDRGLFVSAKVGWVTEGLPLDTSSTACNPVCSTTSVLFRTDDGGLHWTARLTWYGSGPDVIKASADGMEGLALGSDSKNRSVLFHTTDGGAHWTSFGLPPGAGQAVQTVCKTPAFCTQQDLGEQVVFLNPSAGWVFSQEPTFTIADLFHTTDDGAHWNLVRVDIKTQFHLDLAQGLTDSNGVVNHRLPGQFTFRDSSTGWFIPETGLDVYVTRDGGRTWQAQSLSLPVGIQRDQTVSLPAPLFFNDKDGIFTVDVPKPRAPNAPIPYPGTPESYRDQFVYTTSDGGVHWSTPIRVPLSGSSSYVWMDFIDALHWVGWPNGGGLMRTSDAGQHWDVTPTYPSSRGLGLPPVPHSGLPPWGADGTPWFSFLDRSQGWAYVYQSSPSGGRPGNWPGTSLYWTTDGGLDWTPLSLPELR